MGDREITLKYGKEQMVSVIITTYNRRSYLRGAALSVLRQEYREKEVIVVDDGSTDGSYEEIRDLPLRYLWKPNGGVSSARNRGIDMARGRYIGFLDVDDVWRKGKLHAQIEAMKRGDFPVSYTDEVWLRNGQHLNQKKHHRKYSGHIFDKCLPLCIISPSSVVIGREVFGRVGLFDESLPVCEDYDLWLRITSQYPVLFIDKPFITKRGGHPDQLSHKYPAMDQFRVRAIIKILEGGALTGGMRADAVRELRKKCAILAAGAAKRGKAEEAAYYRLLPESF